MVRLIIVWMMMSCCAASFVLAEGLKQPIRRHVKYSFTIQNMTGDLLESAKLYSYAPVASKSFQEVVGIKTSITHNPLIMEGLNQVISFTISDLPPFATKIVSIAVDLELGSTIEGGGITDQEAYLLPESKIESDNHEIIKMAASLKKESKMATAKNIFWWTARRIRYIGYLRESRGALYALRYMEGDCTEYMTLFVALCRAAGIPARGIGGYRCEKNCVLKPSEYHNWAEFYVEGRWHLADPQNKIFMKDESSYVAFHLLEDNNDSAMAGFSRYRYEGDGIRVRMN